MTNRDLQNLIVNGPSPSDYPLIDNIANTKPEILKSNLDKFEFLNSRNSIMGHIKLKPFGYAGDYKIIDRIYTNACSKEYTQWDKYSLQNSAAKAVRNRKTYFIEKMTRSLAQNEDRGADTKLLNLASGPARDLRELYESLESPEKLTTTCVELDIHAIAYAQEIVSKYNEHINFVQKNVLRYTPAEKYKIIWSAGLFDYFDDKAFIFVLSRMKDWLQESGQIIIGNFNEDCNPSRNYMEILGDWYLHHRSSDQLMELALKSGYNKSQISIESEPENVNLFLNITV